MEEFKPNIVVFASDAKHTSYLNSLILEAWGRVNLFYMVCTDTNLRYPKVQPHLFDINHNVEHPESVRSTSLNQDLPFKPDWLVLSRERWDPEAEIVFEFKHRFKAKVAVVEPNSAFINSVNQFLESESKNKFVENIDVFFDHSNFIKEQRALLGFKGNSVVVGNPKFDNNLEVDQTTLEYLKDYYKIDPHKKQVLFFTLQNKFRYRLFEEFKKFKDAHPEYQYFVKPYPGEPFGEKRGEYFPKFFIEDVTPVLEETHIWGMLNICDIHLGSISSVMYPSFLLGKEVHEFSKQIGAQDKLWDNQDILNSEGGSEENLALWLNTFNIDLETLKRITSEKNIKPMLKNNQRVWKNLDNVLSYRSSILELYDEFNDRQASKRIIDYFEN